MQTNERILCKTGRKVFSQCFGYGCGALLCVGLGFAGFLWCWFWFPALVVPLVWLLVKTWLLIFVAWFLRGLVYYGGLVLVWFPRLWFVGYGFGPGLVFFGFGFPGLLVS